LLALREMGAIMKTIFSALLIGMLFGLGLAVSEMINPARVVGFLDVTGAWDPTLLLVMGGALCVTVPMFPLVTKRSRPLLGKGFLLPTKKQIDAPLIAGATLFGIGWGIAGFCPGPAIAGLASLSPSVLFFVAAMLAGYSLGGLIKT
jgi:uncharacterized membrane protein YedE/YeeE